MSLPEYLKQGEAARLFPVLSETSKEGRTTSIVLACMAAVREFGSDMMMSLGQRVGTRTTIQAYTEIVMKDQKIQLKDRPDGLLVLANGSKEWRVLIEAKIGSAVLDPEQVERYRQIAKEHGLDGVVTISNQFATTPTSHPVEDIRRSRSKIPVYHWSWMSILTKVDLLINNGSIEDPDRRLMLNELRRFLSHESAGLRGFDRMPPEWTELNKLVAAGGRISSKSKEASAVLGAWHQETRDLSLILTRQTETVVTERLSKNHIGDPSAREKAEMDVLKEKGQLQCLLEIRDAAAPLEVTVDLGRRTVDVGMTIGAPEDKKSSKARLSWLLRQIKTKETTDLHVTSRKLVWIFLKQLGFELVPIFHGLQGRPAAQN